MARVRSPEESMRDILNAAEQEFADKGFYGARMDEIAEKAHINKRMIYAYFGDKEFLYKQILFLVYARMEAVERGLVEKQFTGRELIREIISAYFHFLKTNPTFVHILMWENLNRGRYLKEMESSKIERQTIRLFAQEIAKGKAEGIFKPEIDEFQTVISLITICFANFSNQYTLSKLFHTDLTSDEMLDERRRYTMDMVMAYLCTDDSK